MNFYQKNRLSILSITLATIALSSSLFSCGIPVNKNSVSDKTTAAAESEVNTKQSYTQLTPEQVKSEIDSGARILILDVRTEDEYNEGHIENALLIPYDEIESRASSELPDKNARILIYCRSGRRSKIAAETLYRLGYTDINEFGGITDWKYGTVTT